MLVDTFQRRITYLRLSVTDRCDLRCAYCMPAGTRFAPRRETLSVNELHRLAAAFVVLGVRTIRVTGGEPLVRSDALELIRALGSMLGHGLDELTLTTNGTRLAAHAGALAATGVRRINVSLDTLDRGRFAKLTGSDRLPQVLEGIAAARDAGMRIKINAVALKDTNEAELPALIEWAHAAGHDVALIEVMPLGDVAQDRIAQFVPLSDVRARLEQRWTLAPSTYRTGGPARYVEVAETGGRVGFITPLSENFCAGCNRIRVTATGTLYPCLGGGECIDLRAALRSPEAAAALADALDQAMRIKPEHHHFAIQAGAPAPLARHMSVTGG